MSKRYESVPIIVQQMAENMLDDKAANNVKFNCMIMVETIRDFCNDRLEIYNKTQQKK